MQVQNHNNIKFTNTAIDEIKKLKNNLPIAEKNKRLRIGVEGGGCTGMTYILKFDETTEEDELFEISEIECCINKTHKLYLFGLELDWKNGLQNRGFSFNNPSASKTCGCGTSFSV